MIINTHWGHFASDPHDATMFHYAYKSGTGTIDVALADAIAYAPFTRGTSWFWFNGTPALMRFGDDTDALYKRWWRVRAEIQRGWTDPPT